MKRIITFSKSTLFTSYIRSFALMAVILFAVSSWGQITIFTESMGTVSSTTAIATHETNNGFDNDDFTMTGGGAASPADIRATSSSSGYTGASGGANVWFTSTSGDRGFAIEGINAEDHTNLTVQFGYRKESASALPSLALDYWNGTNYVNVPFTFNELSNASAGWYLSPVIDLPEQAQRDGLRLRWVKSGSTAVRLDDVVLTGTLGSVPNISVTPSSLTGFTYEEGSGPSAEQSFTVEGSNLEGDITVTPPANWEISLTPGGPFQITPVTLAESGGSVAQTTIYTRLIAGLSAGSYSGDIACTSTNATTRNVAVSGSVLASDELALPSTFNLSSGDYSFTTWDESNDAGTYPANMYFHRTSTQDPELIDEMTNNYNDAYNSTSGTRINGVGTDGITFFNIGTNGNLGAAVLGINASGRKNIEVSWLGGTYASGDRVYNIRLQYKIGSGSWTDVPGPVEYSSSGQTAGHSTTFGPTTLPNECNNQSEIYLRWKYYSEPGGSGSRPRLRLDDITVSSVDITFPIKFENITAKAEGRHVHVDWATAAERNTHYMVVERSTSGREWSDIGRQESAGFSSETKRYRFTDKNPANGFNYYRIRQVDRDGSFSYSRIVSALVQPDRGFSLSPTVASDRMRVEFDQPVDNGRLHIYDLQGNLLSSHTLATGIDILSIDISDMLPGQYLAVYADGDEITTGKFFKR